MKKIISIPLFTIVLISNLFFYTPSSKADEKLKKQLVDAAYNAKLCVMGNQSYKKGLRYRHELLRKDALNSINRNDLNGVRDTIRQFNEIAALAYTASGDRDIYCRPSLFPSITKKFEKKKKKKKDVEEESIIGEKELKTQLVDAAYYAKLCVTGPESYKFDLLSRYELIRKDALNYLNKNDENGIRRAIKQYTEIAALGYAASGYRDNYCHPNNFYGTYLKFNAYK